MLSILAALCGADTWAEVENFGKAKLEWLQTFLELRNGVPSHDTLGRVFSLLDPEQFQLAFLSWVSSLVSLRGEFLATCAELVEVLTAKPHAVHMKRADAKVRCTW